MQKINSYTIFISSPANLSREREIAIQVIEEWMRLHQRCHYNIHHMGNIASDFGKDPQAYINEIADKADIYLGLMGERFGTQTKEYGSGTEEEFTRALKRKLENSENAVTFLFKEMTSPVANIDAAALEQMLKVKTFEQKIADKGYYQRFSTEADLRLHIQRILKKFEEDQDQEAAAEGHQREVQNLRGADSSLRINQDFFKRFLNGIGVEISNNQKAVMQLNDIYVPVDVIERGNDDEVETDIVLSSSQIKIFSANGKTMNIISGDEKAGKTAFCKQSFLKSHVNGFCPIYLKGEKIRNASLESLLRLCSKAFIEQYEDVEDSTFSAIPAEKKVIIIDDFENVSLNARYKASLLTLISENFHNVLITIDPITLFNLNVGKTDEFMSLSNFSIFEIEDIGHKLRDDLICNWIKAGREETISDEELFTTAEKYRALINHVLGTNFVPKKPFVILVLLQAIQGGSSGNLAHSSFVRYYKFLIDRTLLTGVPENRVEIYYSFLPQLAYKLFSNASHDLDGEELDKLILEMSEHVGIDKETLLEVKRNLISMEIICSKHDRYKFKHSYAYYFFLGQYLSENINSSKIQQEIAELSQNLNLKENANIIVFLSYHSSNSLILENIFKVTDELFDSIERFDFDGSSASSLNELVTEGAKVVVGHQAKAHREAALRQTDAVERSQVNLKKRDDIDRADLDAMDFAAHANLAYRSAEILGQLLKNHYVRFDAQQKREIYKRAVSVSLRCLNVLINGIAEDKDSLVEFVTEKSEKINRKSFTDNEKIKREAQRILFQLVAQIIFNFVKAVSNFTGADVLAKTYKDVAEEMRSPIFDLVEFSTKMDVLQEFPVKDLEGLAEKFKDHHLAISTMRSLVKYRLYMRPIDDFKIRHQICSAVGISVERQLQLQKKSVA